MLEFNQDHKSLEGSLKNNKNKRRNYKKYY